jgi:alkanesulfonate monooxygenase SsuD/methylene tetrahydromethanopterin reductase-like flavin-dependent oxidoreductase (luciferase family)
MLWTENNVNYDGDYYQLDNVTVNPKPSDGPLDIWIGGNSDAALKRIAEYGDGWFPSMITPETFSEKLNRLMRYCNDVGREVERDEAGVILLSHVDENPERAQNIQNKHLAQQDFDIPDEVFDKCTAFGTPAECVETIERYIGAGCTKFVLMPVGSHTERIEQIEYYSKSVIPEVS